MRSAARQLQQAPVTRVRCWSGGSSSSSSSAPPLAGGAAVPITAFSQWSLVSRRLAASLPSAAGNRSPVGGVRRRQQQGSGANAETSKFSQLVEFNSRIFNPQKLTPILVTAAGQQGEEQHLRAFMEKARDDLERHGEPGRRIGASGCAASILACRRLGARFGMQESKDLAATLVSTLAAELPRLPFATVVEMAQEIQKHRLPDFALWEALAQATMDSVEAEPAAVVVLLDAFRRSLPYVGDRLDHVFERLASHAVTAAPAMTKKQIVQSVGSISRLGHHIRASEQRRALLILLDKWLDLLEESQRDTGAVPSSQYISLAVSLTNVSEALGVRSAPFVEALSAWAQHCLAADGHLGGAEAPRQAKSQSPSPEEWVVLLWALKELSPLGLGPHANVVSAVLPLVRADPRLGEYTLLRLVQASEVILAARLQAAEQAGQELAPRVAGALADSIAAGDCSVDMLARVVALWDQVGEQFWEDSPQLAVEVLKRAVLQVEEAKEDASVLHRMLGTLVQSSFASSDAFMKSRGALYGAVSAHPAASTPFFAQLLRTLEARAAAAADEAADEKASRKKAKAGGGSGAAAQVEDEEAVLRRLPPLEAAQKVAALCNKAAPDTQVIAAAEAALAGVGTLTASEAVTALGELLRGAAVRRRLVRQPLLLDLVEQLADVVVASAGDLPVLQLTTALTWFAAAGLPYHLLFEAALVAVLDKHQAQTLSWRQVVGTLEAFAAVRLRIPELEDLYTHLRQPQELARLPAMALVRFFSASARLDLLDADGADSRELVDRVLAETTPQKPLPLESSVIMVQSLLFAGVALADRQFRHLFGWVALTRVRQLTPQQLAILRQYSLFLLSHPDAQMRGCMLRLPIEIQRFISGILKHRAPAWVPPTSDTTRRFRSEAAGAEGAGALVAGAASATQSPPAKTPAPGPSVASPADGPIAHAALVAAAVPLGPAGVLDLQAGSRCWLLDGPEAFFRPFTWELRHTPQERARAKLLGRLLADDAARQCVADFFPPASAWPKLDGPRRVNWLQWGRTAPAHRPTLFRVGGMQ